MPASIFITYLIIVRALYRQSHKPQLPRQLRIISRENLKMDVQKLSRQSKQRGENMRAHTWVITKSLGMKVNYDSRTPCYLLPPLTACFQGPLDWDPLIPHCSNIPTLCRAMKKRGEKKRQKWFISSTLYSPSILGSNNGQATANKNRCFQESYLILKTLHWCQFLLPVCSDLPVIRWRWRCTC